jgi:hypothetical protein
LASFFKACQVLKVNKMNELQKKNMKTAVVLIALAASIYAFAVMKAIS